MPDDLEHPTVRAAHDDYRHALERLIEAPVASGRNLTVKIAAATDLLRVGDSKRALGLLSALLADVQLMDLAARRDAELRGDEAASAAARRAPQSAATTADQQAPPVPAGEQPILVDVLLPARDGLLLQGWGAARCG